MIRLIGFVTLLRLQNKKQHITYGKSMVRFCLNNIGRKEYFGQTDTLLAVLEKYRQQLYKSILRVRVNG